MPSESNTPALRLCRRERPLAERSDDELMLLSCAGEKTAFAELLRRHQRAVRNYCARVCRDSSIAEDVAQEVFVKLWQSRGNYVPQGRFRSYLFVIAVNRCNNQLRPRKGQLVPLDGLASEGTAPLQLDELIAGERSARLYALVEKLPIEQRRAITLKFAAELDYSEIAHAVQRSEATVRSRVFFALQRLRKVLGTREPV
jgi:RNA polymerase sigma-70 factor (ECF subfamily)